MKLKEWTEPRDPSTFASRAEALGARARSLHAPGSLPSQPSFPSPHFSEKTERRGPLAGRYVLLGVPDDRGVAANKGHVGAASGPEAFRQAFYKLYDTPLREFCEKTHRPYSQQERAGPGAPREARFVRGWLGDLVFDAGDVKIASTVAETHDRIAACVRELLLLGACRVMVVGGGHDFSYGSYKGHVEATTGLLPIVNLDAHFDLRPLEGGIINSGTPFSRIIEAFPERVAGGRALLELGIQRERNPDSLYEYAAKHQIPTVEFLCLLGLWRRVSDAKECSPLNHVLDHLDECRGLGWSRESGRVHLSIDLDVFHNALAPGTSASTPFGASLTELGPVLSYLGRVSHCSVVDIAELCPPRDIADQTARLAAGLALRLILLREEYATPG